MEVRARRDSGDVDEIRWWRNVCLASLNERAVAPQGEALVPSRRDGYSIGQADWHVCLSEIGSTPSYHSPIASQGAGRGRAVNRESNSTIHGLTPARPDPGLSLDVTPIHGRNSWPLFVQGHLSAWRPPVRRKGRRQNASAITAAQAATKEITLGSGTEVNFTESKETPL